MGSHRLFGLDDNKLSTGLMQVDSQDFFSALCKFFEQLAASLQISVASYLFFTDLMHLMKPTGLM